jgi:glutaredoxin
MELHYTLSLEDLADVQAQVMLDRQARLLGDRRFALWVGLGVAALALPLSMAFSPHTAPLPARLDMALEFAVCLSAAVLGTYFLVPLLPRRRLRRDRDHASFMRLAECAAARSTLSSVTLRMGAEGLERHAGSGETLHVPWQDIRGLLCSPHIITLRLRERGRVLAVPVRAFVAPDEAAAFRRAIELRCGIRSIDVGFDLPPPSTPSMRAWLAHARLPMLATGLTLCTFLFLQLTLLPWLRSPLRSNPDRSVVLYGTDWCPACARVRRCLRDSRVPFEERNVERSAAALQEWHALGADGVPVVLVGQEVVYGASEPELVRVLDAAGHRVPCFRR